MHGIRRPLLQKQGRCEKRLYRYKNKHWAKERNGGKQPGFEILLLMVAIMVALLIRRKK